MLLDRSREAQRVAVAVSSYTYRSLKEDREVALSQLKSACAHVATSVGSSLNVSMSDAMKLRLTSAGGYHGFKGLKEEAKRRKEKESRKACSPLRRAVKWVRTGRGGADRCDSNLHSDDGGGGGQQQGLIESLLRLVCEKRRQGAKKTRTRMRGL
ncbi:hypothetical protein G5I_08533 [Acromyrmex echinatior]|uniref:Uncharacterized protein n=1 Tax=Acromyrmex echinatior TaxID=103372 RepID=F4WRT0_ACREC|nr:hypothetical protein G5I_08533 [Acromyrmex echinatior]